MYHTFLHGELANLALNRSVLISYYGNQLVPRFGNCTFSSSGQQMYVCLLVLAFPLLVCGTLSEELKWLCGNFKAHLPRCSVPWDANIYQCKPLEPMVLCNETNVLVLCVCCLLFTKPPKRTPNDTGACQNHKMDGRHLRTTTQIDKPVQTKVDLHPHHISGSWGVANCL